VEALSLASSGNRALDWEYTVRYPGVKDPVVFEMRSEGLPFGVTREKTLQILEAGFHRQKTSELGLANLSQSENAIKALLQARRATPEIHHKSGELSCFVNYSL